MNVELVLSNFLFCTSTGPNCSFIFVVVAVVKKPIPKSGQVSLISRVVLGLMHLISSCKLFRCPVAVPLWYFLCSFSSLKLTPLFCWELLVIFIF